MPVPWPSRRPRTRRSSWWPTPRRAAPRRLSYVIGTALAYGGIQLLLYLQPAQLPRLNEIRLDPIVLLFTLAISLAAGLLFGAIPILKYARPHMASALKDSSRGSSEGRERHRARNTLVVAQVALAAILLVASGLMVRTFLAIRDVPPGFRNPESVLTFRISIPTAVVGDLDQVARMHEEIARRLEVHRTVPGVEAEPAVPQGVQVDAAGDHGAAHEPRVQRVGGQSQLTGHLLHRLGRDQADRGRHPRHLAEEPVPHHALPGDDLSLAQERGGLHRNFMGYTTHADSDLVGMGVSAISHIGDTFSQNPRDLPSWEIAIDSGKLPTWRGMLLDAAASRLLDHFGELAQPRGAELARFALERVRGNDHCGGILRGQRLLDLGDRLGAVLLIISEDTCQPRAQHLARFCKFGLRHHGQRIIIGHGSHLKRGKFSVARDYAGLR